MQWADPDERAMIDRLNAGLFRPIGFELRIEPGDGGCVRVYHLSTGVAQLWYPNVYECLFGPSALICRPKRTSVFAVRLYAGVDRVTGKNRYSPDFSRFGGCSSLEELGLRLAAEGF